MSYLTFEVEINHGKVFAKEPQQLPETGVGLLTIFNAATPDKPRPVGLARGEFKVPEDFNAPLSEEVLRSFEG